MLPEKVANQLSKGDKMSRSIDYKITPMSVSAVVGFYKLGTTNAVAGYREYLDQNVESHHYNDLTIDEWFIAEVQVYVDYLVEKSNKPLSTENDQCRAWAN